MRIAKSAISALILLTLCNTTRAETIGTVETPGIFIKDSISVVPLGD
jgi:catabolite regulation protein CreA